MQVYSDQKWINPFFNPFNPSISTTFEATQRSVIAEMFGWSWDPDSTNPERATYCFTCIHTTTNKTCTSLLCFSRVPLKPISSFDTAKHIYVKPSDGSIQDPWRQRAKTEPKPFMDFEHWKAVLDQKPLRTNWIRLVARLTRSGPWNNLELTELTQSQAPPFHSCSLQGWECQKLTSLR